MKKNTTRRALILSVLSLILCASMLVGTTYAWFTDTVASTGNKIQSGSLKIDLELLTKQDDGSYKWESIEDNPQPIFNYNLWEPGYTDVKLLKVVNDGNLALKWYAKLETAAQLSKLADVIDVYVNTTVQSYPADRADLSGWTKVGSVAQFVNTMSNTTHGTLLKNGDEAYLGIALKMREEAGNEYQDLDLGGAFDITIYATQYTYESDSFDDQYDAGAAWTGAVGEVPVVDAEGYITITSPEQLAALAASVNGGNDYNNQKIRLASDIDLNNIAWTPIGVSGATFNGDFYGDGHAILNLNVSGVEGVGLFGIAGNSAHIEGIVVDRATVAGNHWVGAILGYGYLSANCLRNCTVKNATVTAVPKLQANGKYDDGDKAGAIAGMAINGTIAGNKAENCTVSAYRDFGAIVGCATAEGRNITIEKNESVDVVLSYVTIAGQYADNTPNQNMGAIYGRTTTKYSNVVNVTTDNKVDGKEVTIVNNKDAIAKAVTVPGAVVSVNAGTYGTLPSNIAEGVVLNCAEGTVFEGTSSLNINGSTVVGAAFVNEDGTAVKGTINGTFKNCTFTGNEALRWCYTNSGDTVVFENCVIKTDFRGVHFDGMNGDVVFRNCEINGFNAYSGTGTITFEGCTFGCDESKYNGLNIYSNTNLVDCTFNYLAGKTNFIDMEGTGKTLTITNCTATLNNEPANVLDFVGGSKLAQNTIIFEGAQCVTTNDALKAAIESRATKILLANGDYSVRFTNQTSFNVDGMTIVGLGDAVKLSVSSSEAWYGRIQGDNVTFENITFTGQIGATGMATYNNCNITYLECASSGNRETFVNDCTLGQIHTSGDFSAGNAYVKDSTITKAEYAGSATMYFENCTIGELISWNMDTVLTNCTVTAIDNSHMTSGSITIK